MSLDIFPNMLAMLLATKLLMNANFIVDLISLIPNLTSEFLLLGTIKPFSGNASYALLIEIYTKYGVDSDTAIVSSILQSSKDTTFYIVAIYTGCCGINKQGRVLPLGLFGDLLAFFGSLLLFYLFF